MQEKKKINYECGCWLVVEVFSTYDMKFRKFTKAVAQKELKMCDKHAREIEGYIKDGV